jgi:small-conductance mechanosensitive channel
MDQDPVHDPGHHTTYDGRRVVIPNASLFTESVIVNTAFDQRRLEYDVGIGVSDDIDTAKTLILQAVRSVDGVLAEPAPDVLVVQLADFLKTLTVVAQCVSDTARRQALLFHAEMIVRGSQQGLPQEHDRQRVAQQFHKTLQMLQMDVEAKNTRHSAGYASTQPEPCVRET